MAPLPLVTKLNLGNKRHTSHYDYLLKNGRGWKCKNVADAQITAEIALREAIYVRDEVIAIGTGNSQAATLANTNNLTDYYFALKFNGVIQTGNFTFNPTSGQVTFIVVTASYFYNWGAEKKRAHIPTSTTKDARRRSSRIRVRRAMLRR